MLHQVRYTVRRISKARVIMLKELVLLVFQELEQSFGGQSGGGPHGAQSLWHPALEIEQSISHLVNSRLRHHVSRCS
jgi:hypothetical protein